jgi:DNA-binding IclR family transcriptional regulator
VTGVCGVAAPVVNSAGDVSAATGIPCPAERLNYRALHNYRPLVRDVAARLPHDLGAVTAYAERSPRASAPRSARSHPLRD